MLSKMAAVTIWMALWWLTEVVHLAVTSLLPFLLLPILGIAEPKIVAAEYMDPIMFLFIGGFMIALAMERWNLHKRIALKILMKVGTSPARILGGVMLTCYLMSMWISNTATVMMLLAAVMAVIHQLEKSGKQDKIAAALLIGLAYAASIGGMATLVGTPPNMVFYRFYTNAFPESTDINFASWFAIGFPVSVCFLVVTYFILKKMFLSGLDNHTYPISYFKTEYDKLGKRSFEENAVSVIFTITALLWFTRADIDFGNFKIPGWNNFFPKSSHIQDGTVAVFMAILLFLIPSKKEKGRMLMSWDEAQKLPYDILLLFGSGFALAKGFELSGMNTWIAGHLSFLTKHEPFILIGGLCIVVCIISEFASNVASIQLTLPVLLPLLNTMDIHPALLMIPATLAASLGFMLPVATGPNTIVFGSKRIKVSEMMRVGFLIDIAGIIIITIGTILLLKK